MNKPCQGQNCGTTEAKHSIECLTETAKDQGWDITSLGADADCSYCYDTGHIIVDDTGPEYITSPCPGCTKE